MKRKPVKLSELSPELETKFWLQCEGHNEYPWTVCDPNNPALPLLCEDSSGLRLLRNADATVWIEDCDITTAGEVEVGKWFEAVADASRERNGACLMLDNKGGEEVTCYFSGYKLIGQASKNWKVRLIADPFEQARDVEAKQERLQEALGTIAERRVLIMDDLGETEADALVKVAKQALEGGA